MSVRVKMRQLDLRRYAVKRTRVCKSIHFDLCLVFTCASAKYRQLLETVRYMVIEKSKNTSLGRRWYMEYISVVEVCHLI